MTDYIVDDEVLKSLQQVYNTLESHAHLSRDQKSGMMIKLTAAMYKIRQGKITLSKIDELQESFP